MKRLILLLVVICIFTVTACAKTEAVEPKQPKQDSAITVQYQNQVKELKVKNGRLKMENAELEKQIRKLEKRVGKRGN